MITNISFNQKQPKYRIGDRVKQGLIIGLECCPPGSYLARTYSNQWRYTLLLDRTEEDLEYIYEPSIKPLSPQQIKSQIQSEINLCKQQLDALQCELADLAAGQLSSGAA